MLHKLDDHANTSCVLEGRVREQPLVTRPYSVTGRALGGWGGAAVGAPTRHARVWGMAMRRLGAQVVSTAGGKLLNAWFQVCVTWTEVSTK